MKYLGKTDILTRRKRKDRTKLGWIESVSSFDGKLIE